MVLPSIFLLALAGLSPLVRAQYYDDSGSGDIPLDPASADSGVDPTASPIPTSANATAGGAPGDRQCSRLICISAALRGNTVQYVMQSTGIQETGWMSVGFGSAMTGSPMVVMWADQNGGISLSQRIASDRTLPSVDPNPPRAATVNHDLTVLTGPPRFAFTVPHDNNPNPKLIYAFGSDAPTSPDPSTATFGQHLSFGLLFFDLTKTDFAAAELEDPSLARGSARDRASAGSLKKASAERVILAHAIICALAFLVVMPAGALLARYYRTFSPTWFQGHWILQFAIGAPLALTGAVLAACIARAGGPNLSNSHTQVGVLLFVMYALQCLFGGVIHFVKPKKVKQRPVQNYAHAIMGITVIAVGFYQVRTGYVREWPNAVGRPAPNAINILWYVWAVGVPVCYAAGLALLKKQYAQEAASRKQAPKVSSWPEVKPYRV